MALKEYITIPENATKPGSPVDAFLLESLRFNDKNTQDILAALNSFPWGCDNSDSEGLPGNTVVVNGGNAADMAIKMIRARKIEMTAQVDLHDEVPLIWMASESITISAKINAVGKGAKAGTSGDFGGGGGSAASAAPAVVPPPGVQPPDPRNGGACKIPGSGVTMLVGKAGTPPAGPGNKGANADAKWSSRALGVLALCKGGAPGGSDGANPGGSGGGMVVLCAPKITFSPGGDRIDASGAAGGAGNAGGGGGGVVILIAKEFVGDVIAGPGQNIKVAFGAKAGNGGDGGDGIVVKRIVK
ncbi:MAG: hypothetical protein H6581_14060 [Bacteroidia bacterium]|nr:hypothetical protein [Bacteroidia bacterium]